MQRVMQHKTKPTGTRPRHERPSQSPASRDDNIVAFGRYQRFPRLPLLLKDGVRLDVGERALDVLVQLVNVPCRALQKLHAELSFERRQLAAHRS